MHGAYRLQQSRRLTAAQQRLQLAQLTQGSCSSRVSGMLRWRYRTRPSPIGRDYDILITYSLGRQPATFVVSPLLTGLTDNEIPHSYPNERDPEYPDATSLCLFRQTYGDWNAQKSIAETIVPWTDLWLYFFEYWLATGEWLGGGEHPNPMPPRRPVRARTL